LRRAASADEPHLDPDERRDFEPKISVGLKTISGSLVPPISKEAFHTFPRTGEMLGNPGLQISQQRPNRAQVKFSILDPRNDQATVLKPYQLALLSRNAQATILCNPDQHGIVTHDETNTKLCKWHVWQYAIWRFRLQF
jgi:hypothetical protein